MAPNGIEFIARGLVRRDGRVLLCRNVRHGYRYLPGGHVEPGESASEALVREFEEETGTTVRVGAPLLACENRFAQKGEPRHELSVVFHVERTPDLGPPPPRSLEDRIAFDWVDEGGLADAALMPTPIRDWLIDRLPDLGPSLASGQGVGRGRDGAPLLEWLSVDESG